MQSCVSGSAAPKTDDDDDDIVDDHGGSVVTDAILREEKEKQRVAKKPVLDRFKDAVIEENGQIKFVPSPGDKVIIERYLNRGSERKWFDTRMYVVTDVDRTTGDLRLYNPEFQNQAGSNYITGTQEHGYIFKIPPANGKWRQQAKRPKSPETNSSTPHPGSRGNPGKPGLRRVYNTRGIVHTRLQGVAFGPQNSTRAVDGDRLKVSKPDSQGRVIVEHPDGGWKETWVGVKV